MPFELKNPWKENLKDTPKESLNWRLWFGVFVFGLMGAAVRLNLEYPPVISVLSC
jgi:hypothetical protein